MIFKTGHAKPWAATFVLLSALTISACDSAGGASKFDAPMTVESILASLKCENPSSFATVYAQSTGYQCADWSDAATEIVVFQNFAALEVAAPNMTVPDGKKAVLGPLWVLFTQDGDVAINAVEQGGRSVG